MENVYLGPHNNIRDGGVHVVKNIHFLLDFRLDISMGTPVKVRGPEPLSSAADTKKATR